MKPQYTRKSAVARNNSDIEPAPPPKGTCSNSWREAFRACQERRRAAGKLVLESFGTHNLARRTQ